ncbi:MAG TPA: transcription elongation factor Spt5 [Candidatus Nanoarchaeia archaeon]|nr:transcription elongation factor Spt5 [Candidatus Nanoarchaeia archaeon]
MPIFIVRTTAGREHQVADRILILAEREKGIVKSIMHPDLRGYLFVEADNRDEVVQFVYGMHNVKGVIAEPVLMEKLKHFFAVETKEIVVKEGDIVELISTPFKGEKAKIKRINKVKEEVVVELLEAAVPIPMTVSIDNVRLIQSSEGDASGSVSGGENR